LRDVPQPGLWKMITASLTPVSLNENARR
jgi:hypothetical protein